MNTSKSLTALVLGATILAGDLAAQAPEVYEAGPYSTSRLRLGEFLDDIDLQQWRDTLIIGYSTGGFPWRGIIRMGVDQPYGLGNTTSIPMERLQAATRITWTTGIVWKQNTNGVQDPAGGVDIGVYFVPDLTIPEGATPTFLHYGFPTFAGASKVADIARDIPFTNPESAWGTELMDAEHLTIEIDITDQVKAALAAGQIVSGNSIAMGLVQTEYDDFDPAQIPVGFEDLGRMSIVSGKQSFFTLSFDDVGPVKGPGEFGDFDVIDGYVNTGSWLGWVYVEEYPWCYIVELDKYIYASGSEWFFIGR